LAVPVHEEVSLDNVAYNQTIPTAQIFPVNCRCTKRHHRPKHSPESHPHTRILCFARKHLGDNKSSAKRNWEEGEEEEEERRKERRERRRKRNATISPVSSPPPLPPSSFLPFFLSSFLPSYLLSSFLFSSLNGPVSPLLYQSMTAHGTICHQNRCRL
jgi:hypothetical protein